jgi:hypothetical protein
VGRRGLQWFSTYVLPVLVAFFMLGIVNETTTPRPHKPADALVAFGLGIALYWRRSQPRGRDDVFEHNPGAAREALRSIESGPVRHRGTTTAGLHTAGRIDRPRDRNPSLDRPGPFHC